MCIRDSVCTPPPVIEAISENVIPKGVIPVCSRFPITTPLENGSIPHIHSKHPQLVIGSSIIEYNVTFSSAPCEYVLTASSVSYTHLDVYKRQDVYFSRTQACPTIFLFCIYRRYLLLRKANLSKRPPTKLFLINLRLFRRSFLYPDNYRI